MVILTPVGLYSRSAVKFQANNISGLDESIEGFILHRTLYSIVFLGFFSVDNKID
jgi:hypothetical protein